MATTSNFQLIIECQLRTNGTISLTLPNLYRVAEGPVSPHWLVNTRTTPSFHKSFAIFFTNIIARDPWWKTGYIPEICRWAKDCCWKRWRHFCSKRKSWVREDGAIEKRDKASRADLWRDRRRVKAGKVSRKRRGMRESVEESVEESNEENKE